MKPQDYINNLLKETNFSKVIQIRAEFQKKYPKEFKDYLEELSELDKKPWVRQCMSCKNWENNKCIKNLKPVPVPRTSDRLEFFCSAWVKYGTE